MNSKTSISFIGINLGHGRPASNQLNSIMAKSDSIIALVQEPLVNKAKNVSTRFAGEGGGVRAIAAPSQNTTLAAIFYKGAQMNFPILVPALSNDDCTVALWTIGNNKIVLVSFYLPMKADTDILFNFLEKIEKFANGRPVIFHGDLNSRSTILTGDKADNTNGRKLFEWTTNKNSNFTMINQKYAFTFMNQTGTASSIIDYTFVTNNGLDLISEWHVSNTFTFSDHRYIGFLVSVPELPTNKKKIFDFKNADWIKFDCTLKAAPAIDSRLTTATQLDKAVRDEMELIRHACSLSIPLRNIASNRNV